MNLKRMAYLTESDDISKDQKNCKVTVKQKLARYCKKKLVDAVVLVVVVVVVAVVNVLVVVVVVVVALKEGLTDKLKVLHISPLREQKY